MGEYAETILEGIVCESCGVYIGSAVGNVEIEKRITSLQKESPKN